MLPQWAKPKNDIVAPSRSAQTEAALEISEIITHLVLYAGCANAMSAVAGFRKG
jgi:alkylhydroperoxidase/carboxymuconolactone decarboxylase family protein YurZ